MNTEYSYTQLNSRLNKRQNVKVENNTYAYKVDDTIHIDLHGNTIAQLTDNTIILYSCGWLTSTTKDRFNKMIPHPYSICQDKGQWFIYNQITRAYEGIFQDGLTLKFQSGQWYVDSSTMGQDTTALRKRILKYVKGYITALKSGKIELPSSGDCWHCCMHDDKGKSLGELWNNPEHLKSHIEESYYVPSLLYNAIRQYPVSSYAYWIIQNSSDAPIDEKDYWIIDTQVYSSLKRYMFKQFGLPT